MNPLISMHSAIRTKPFAICLSSVVLQPPTSLLKDLTKCKHPNSRRTKALAKKAKRFNNRDKIKFGHAARSNVLGEKFAWFMERIGDAERTEPLQPAEFDEMISAYLRRFDEEVEQIELKQSISKGRAHQHHSRLNAIKMTVDTETGEYNGGGWSKWFFVSQYLDI